jgi:Uma2 family endonuclease
MGAGLKPLTLEEFLAWEATQGERFEFDGVQPVAMTGGSVAHARLVRRLVAAISKRLRSGCEAFGGDLKVVVGDRVRYPDATIVCGALRPGDDRVEPLVVFEVPSPSTALVDRRVKAAEYAGVAAIQSCVMLEQDQPAATILRRAIPWREEQVAGPAAVLHLPQAGVSIPLAEFHA